MPEDTRLKVEVSEAELTSELMRQAAAYAAPGLQERVELFIEYGKAYLQAWTDMNHRVIKGAASRVKVANESETLEEQEHLTGKHAVEGMVQMAEECARFSHRCAVLGASFMTAIQKSGDAGKGLNEYLNQKSGDAGKGLNEYLKVWASGGAEERTQDGAQQGAKESAEEATERGPQFPKEQHDE